MATERDEGAAAELRAATRELEAALEALRSARATWVGAKPWIGARTWDTLAARRAIEEAEARLQAARTRLERAMAKARDTTRQG